LPDAPLQFLWRGRDAKGPGMLAQAREDEIEDVLGELLRLASQSVDRHRPLRRHLARKSSCAALATWSGERPYASIK
jgi:hypothetical protein